MLQTLVHKNNISEMDMIREFAKSVGIRFIAWKSLALDLGVKLGDNEFKSEYERLIVDKEVFNRYSGLLRNNTQKTCPFGLMNGVVLSNGDYVVCTHDANAEIVIGNLQTSSYLELINNEFEQIRSKVSEKQLSICESCSMSTNLGYIEDLQDSNAIDGTVNFSNFDQSIKKVVKL